MTDTMTRSCVVLSVFCLLAGCSGGGTSGYSPPPPAPPLPTPIVPVNFQPASTTVTYLAASVTATGVAANMGNITMSAAGEGPPVILSTDASGNLSSLAIPAGKITLSGYLLPSLQSKDPLDPFDVIASSGVDVTLSQVAASQGLASSVYGLWGTNSGGGDDIGGIAFGNLTAPARIPLTGMATFNGSTFAVGGPANGAAAWNLKGDAQIVANFAAQTVTTNLTNFTVDCYCAPLSSPVPNLSGTSMIDDNAYSGPISGGGMTGTISGNFYGSSAQETAGVWKASGGGNIWLGSFGARQ